MERENTRPKKTIIAPLHGKTFNRGHAYVRIEEELLRAVCGGPHFFHYHSTILFTFANLVPYLSLTFRRKTSML
jgi:hypothetical protein